MRSLSSDGRSKKRNGCLLPAASSSASSSSSSSGDGALEGRVDGAWDEAGDGCLEETAEDARLEMAGVTGVLRFLAMMARASGGDRAVVGYRYVYRYASQWEELGTRPNRVKAIA